MTTVYAADEGTKVLADCKANISTATVRKIAVRAPDGTVAEYDATLEGTDFVYIITTVNTFPIGGQYAVQPIITLPTGKWRGKTATVEVRAAFG